MANTYVSLDGGLDLVTPPIEAEGGKCVEALNVYEAVKGGYTTLLGYEEFDGRPAPSKATYYHIYGSSVVGTPTELAVGASLSIGTFTTTIAANQYDGAGDVVLIGSESSGDTPDTTDYPVTVTIGSGTFVVNTLIPLGRPSQSWETGTYSSYLDVVQERRRNLISSPTGTGSIKGVAQINGEVLAWRNASGTGSVAYKASSTGWQAIPYAEIYEVDVSAGTAATVGAVCNSGEIVILGVYDYITTGSASADTGKRVYTVKRVSGSVPTSFTNDVGSVNHGSVLGQVAWQPAAVTGSVSYINHNFYGGSSTYNTYFGDGVNVPMWYSTADNVISPIATNYRVLSEVAGYVVAFNSRLFISTTGGTFITSVAGSPEILDGTLGSAELGVGDTITGFAKTSSTTLAIFTTHSTWGLTGKDSSDWVLQLISQNSGARAGCIAQTDDVFSSDDRGIAKLSRTQTLGGFAAATITDDVQPRFQGLNQYATCATTLRSLNQMRFFYGGSCLIASQISYNANGKDSVRFGITEASYPVGVRNISTEEDLSGLERTFFGGDDGNVYQMDSGNNHNGLSMSATVTLQHNHFGTPTTKKRFMGVGLEAVVRAPTEFEFYYTMNDARKTFNRGKASFVGGDSRWDSAVFDLALFGASTLTRDKITLKGTGYNIQFSFYRKATQDPQASLTGYTLRYKERGLESL